MKIEKSLGEEIDQDTESPEPTSKSGAELQAAFRQIAESESESRRIFELIKTMRPNRIVHFDGEIGDDAPIKEPDVDIVLHPSREQPIAGELWSIAAEFKNRGSCPVWIIDTKTQLTLPPELYGLLSRAGSSGAFFPTIMRRREDEIIRIDPGANYSVSWRLDPVSSEEEHRHVWSITRRVIRTVRSFLFFNPGTFHVSLSAHIWLAKPSMDENGHVINPGSSFCKDVSRDITMIASPWVLIVGAASGGVLAFLSQLLTGVVGFEGDWITNRKRVATLYNSFVLECICIPWT